MSKIELRFSCFDLKNLDVLSKSDPQVIVQQTFGQGLKPITIGKTEKIKNNLSPVFKTPITMDYYFETVQSLRFIVIDIDGEVSDIDKPDYIGEINLNLADIIASRKVTKQLRDKKNNYSGEIQITAEEKRNSGYEVSFGIVGFKFDKKDLFSSDPYFNLYRFSPSLNENVLAYKSEVIKSNCNPVFKIVNLKLEDFNGCDENTPLLFEFYDHDDVGKHDMIGILKTTTKEITTNFQSAGSFDIINPKKNKSAGTIKFNLFNVFRRPTFLDYIYTGTELNLTVAIDCTYSNGPVNYSTSLHRQAKSPTDLNQYESSIISVGNVLQSYDADGLIPVYGFGASTPNDSNVQHCFAMNLNEADPNAKGVADILNVYRYGIDKISLSGPTNFAPVIQKVISNSPPTQYKYNILLIITDGEITDIEETKAKIVDASKLPMSIIIVGVGSSNYADQLDSDDKLLKDKNGRQCERDIVQYVHYSQAATKGPEYLAKELLKEVPNQLLQYMANKKFQPTPRTN